MDPNKLVETASAAKKTVVKPQDGFQIEFLSSKADIVIGGGAAGLGKSWSLLAAPLRHKDTERFNCIVFRRTTEQIRNPGGLWDKSTEIYPFFGLRPSEQQLEWYNPKVNGVTLKFSHLQYEKDIYSHDGPEYCLICWDELQSFTRKQFFYLLSRNRSTCGVMPYVLATCNPDPDSWLAEFIEWWIDQREKLHDGSKNPAWGLPIQERIGVIRYFMVNEDKYIWGSTKQQIVDENPELFGKDFDRTVNPHDLIKSVTFISGSIFDNQELLKRNPQYLANLSSLDHNERLRLLNGNWKVRGKDDCIFDSTAIIEMMEGGVGGTGDANKRYITCDVARFGRDLATIFVWIGWKVVKLVVLTKCDANDLIAAIEKERNKFSITRGNVIVDQDGVGGGVVKMGRYLGFSGNNPAMEDPGTYIKENYRNRNVQFAYRLADRVNNNEVSVELTNENVVVDNAYGCRIKIGGVVHDVRELIKQDFRAIRMKELSNDGKKDTNDKPEQKRLCGGRSPDFFDAMKMRIHYEIKNREIRVGSPTVKGMRGGRGGLSLLDRL